MSCTLCIRLVPVWMARPREGHPYGHNSAEVSIYMHDSLFTMYVFFLSVLAIEGLTYARVFMLVSTAGHIALFPLLYQPAGEMLYALCLEPDVCHVHTFLPC